MRLAKRIEKLPPYLFVEISRKIAERRARGEEVISFGIGDPDLPTPAHILDCLCQAARDPVNHRYPETDGLSQLRQAIAGWYQNRFGVSLDADNIENAQDAEFITELNRRIKDVESCTRRYILGERKPADQTNIDFDKTEGIK